MGLGLRRRTPPPPPPPRKITPVDYGAPEWARRLYPLVQAPNKHVTLLPEDWRAGLLVIGAQESGKTTILLRQYLNACMDPDAAVVLIDPKRTLGKRALAMTPPECGKRVWYLNLVRPAFGMSPLRAPGRDQAIIEMFLGALRDVFPDQLFQSSASIIGNTAAGALAVARAEERYPQIEDMRGLMVWEREELRGRAIAALAKAPNGDVTRDYFAVELPGEMGGNQADMRRRLQAPRNKLDALLQSPSLRIFFNHTYEKPLAEIVRDREILIVDANLGEAGKENSRLMISFVLRMLDLVLQQQYGMAPERRSRVHLLVDESPQVFRESTIEMITNHRESGLTAAFGAHYLAQFESEKVLHGLLALVANRCMFRTSDDEDSKRLMEVARAVLAAVRPTPESRDRQRFTVETLRDLPAHFCVCAWLAQRSRQPAFIGRTYPMAPEPSPLDGYIPDHLLALADEVGEYPEHLLWTLREPESDTETVKLTADGERGENTEKAKGAGTVCPKCGAAAIIKSKSEYGGGYVCWEKKGGCGARFAEDPAQAVVVQDHTGAGADNPPTVTGADASVTADGEPADVAEPSATFGERAGPVHGRRQSARELARSALLDGSEARLAHHTDPLGIDPAGLEAHAPGPIKELHEHGGDLLRRAEPADEPVEGARLPRLNDRDLSALSALDRLGYMSLTQLGRCSWPGRTAESVRQTLGKLANAGLVYRYSIVTDNDRGGRAPYLYALAPRGLEVAKDPPGDRRPSIHAGRNYRPCTATDGRHIRHNLCVGTWAISFLRAFPTVTSDRWWTDRWPQGHIDVPTVPVQRGRPRPITVHEVKVPESYCLVDVAGPEGFAPDLTIELTLPREGREPLVSDLLVEVDNTSEPGYNERKFRRYDSFLTGWALSHPRYQRLGTRPVVLFVARDKAGMKALMARADEVMCGAIGLAGTPQLDRWYYAGRDHVFFTYQEPIHYGLPSAWMLSPYPPEVREQLGDRGGYRIWPVSLLAPELVAKDAMVGWELRAGRAVPVRAKESA
jgi:hypothetical protein